jgi:hypothetical protein
MACGAISFRAAAPRPPRAAVDFASGGDEAAKRNGSFAKRNERFRSAGRKPLKSLSARSERFAKRNGPFRNTGRKPLKSLGAKPGHFAEVFVFNDLTTFLFR